MRKILIISIILILSSIYIQSCSMFNGCNRQGINSSNQNTERVLKSILQKELLKFMIYIDSTCNPEKYSYIIYFQEQGDENTISITPFVNLDEIEFTNSKGELFKPVWKGFYKEGRSIITLYEQYNNRESLFYNYLNLNTDTTEYQFPPSRMPELLQNNGSECGVTWVYDIINNDSIVFNREIRIQ